MVWTFDPLVARNGCFNVVKLGAQLTRYYLDFYGPMDDGSNDGDETHRWLVTWRVDSPRAVAAAAGSASATDIDAVRDRGALEVLKRGPSGVPVSRPADADVLVVPVPPDIVDLRHRDARTRAIVAVLVGEKCQPLLPVRRCHDRQPRGLRASRPRRPPLKCPRWFGAGPPSALPEVIPFG